MEYHVRGPHRPAGLAAVALAGCALLAAVGLLAGQLRDSDDLRLQSVPREILEELRIEVVSPGRASLIAVDLEAATRILNERGERPLKERPVLVEQDLPEGTRVSWAFSVAAIPPASQGPCIPRDQPNPFPEPTLETTYYLVLIDAHTGAAHGYQGGSLLVGHCAR